MSGTNEIAPNYTIPTLPPLPGVVLLVHAPHEGDGQNWPLARAQIGVTAKATQLSWQRIF